MSFMTNMLWTVAMLGIAAKRCVMKRWYASMLGTSTSTR